MQKTHIEWVYNPDGSQGYSWNPIKGLCPMNCKTPDGKEYCYARKIYKRFKLDEQIWLDIAELHEPFNRNSKKIFTCSTFELFHPVTNQLVTYSYRAPHKITKMRNLVFDVIEKNPQHTFIILTKLPQKIDRPMPKNVWLGMTITGNSKTINEYKRTKSFFSKRQAPIQFVSMEPVFGFPFGTDFPYIPLSNLDWVIAGRLTGHGKKHDPPKKWIEILVENCEQDDISLFLKNNLIPIMGEDYIKAHQEMPKREGD